MSVCRNEAGRLFQILGPAAEKLLSPNLVCVRGTVRRCWIQQSSRNRPQATHVLLNAGAANTEGPNSALPMATDPLRYLRSEPGAAEYTRLPMPGTNRRTPLMYSCKASGGGHTLEQYILQRHYSWSQTSEHGDIFDLLHH